LAAAHIVGERLGQRIGDTLGVERDPESEKAGGGAGY
jgi:hypothetical protein